MVTTTNGAVTRSARTFNRGATAMAVVMVMFSAPFCAHGILIPKDLSSLADRCESAATGTVLSVQSFWNGDGSKILTEVQIRVKEDLKGNADAPGGVLTLTELGGTVGDTTLTVEHVPEFNVGEEVLVFTEVTPYGRRIVCGRERGKLTLRPAPGLAFGPDGKPLDKAQGAARGTMTRARAGRDIIADVRQTMVNLGFQPKRLEAANAAGKTSAEDLPPIPSVIGPSLDAYRYVRERHPQAREIPEKREAGTKHFDNGDGTYTCAAGADYHFLNEKGEWQDSDLTLREFAADRNYAHQCLTSRYKSYFPTLSGGLGFILRDGDASVEVWNAPRMVVTSADGTPASELTPSAVGPRLDGSKLSYEGVYPGVDDQFTVMMDGIKHNITLRQLPKGVRRDSLLHFTGTVNLPEGAQVSVQGVGAPAQFTADSFSIVLGLGQQGGPFCFTRPLFFDGTLDQGTAEFLAYAAEEKLTPEQRKQKAHLALGSYFVKNNGASLQISISVPGEWLTAAGTVFPVVLDPTVYIGTGTLWQRPPWDISYNYARSQSIYLSSELGFSGTITCGWPGIVIRSRQGIPSTMRSCG